MKKRTLVCFLIFTLCIFHSSIPGTVFGQDADPTPEQLAQQVFDEHNQVLQRANVKQYLPEIFEGLKGDLPLPLSSIINLAITSLESDPTGASLKGLAANFGVTLTDNQIAVIADADVQKVLKDDTTVALLSLTGDDLTAGLDELLRLINAPVDPPVEPPVEPPVDPPVEPPVEPPVDPPVEPPVEPPVDPPVEPPVEPPVTPPGDLTPSNLNGQSRLGGLSLNPLIGENFVRDLIAAFGVPRETAETQVDLVVDTALDLIPEGFLPKELIGILQSVRNRKSIPIFHKESPQLDPESFGNAITPSLSEIVYRNVLNVTKYLKSDNLNLYVRVPSALAGGSVKFNLNGQTVNGKRIELGEFQADTIDHIFRLEETLAATNLPAWPDWDENDQLFESVVLRYSQDGLRGNYIAVDMDPVPGENEKGYAWESKIGIIPRGSVFYYFEVTLAQPVKLEIFNGTALAQKLASADGTSTEPAIRQYPEIRTWSMPDPLNLQLADRGIFDALFDDDVKEAAIPVVGALLAGQNVPGKDLNRLTNRLLRNAQELTSDFESHFDPLLASVFTIPRTVDDPLKSIWIPDHADPNYAILQSISEGQNTLTASVHNANGDTVDMIMADFIADASAPKADIVFGDGVANLGDNVTGYKNTAGVWVATAPTSGAPAVVSISSKPENPTELGQDLGYLLYQVIPLDADGNPEGTWLPLTAKSIMLASDLWKLVQEQLATNPDKNIQGIANLPLVDVLAGLSEDDPLIGTYAGLLRDFANPFLKPLGIGLVEANSEFLVRFIGAVIDDINALPLTFDPSLTAVKPIQGEAMDLLEGDYGIRAMGIDHLLNVGAHVPPTHLRIVAPEYDRTSVTMASLGDINHNGKDDPYESGTIYANARDVTLTITVNERTVHPGTIMVQYMAADGSWKNIGELSLAEATGAAGDTLTIDWSAPDMEGDAVMVRTVTTNGLQLTSESDPFSITLDHDVFPVDPKVLVVDVVAASIMDDTSPDSGAPRGNITLTGYAARRTVPATMSIRVDVSMDGETWTDAGTVGVMTEPEHGIDGAKTALEMFKGNTLAAVYDADMLHIDETSSYIQWSLDIDTVALELADSITKENLDAAHAASNKAGMTYVDLDGNRYMVRAYPVTSDGDDADGVAEGDMFTEKFSLDNVDDVGPLGPTNIVATMTNAYEDTGVFIDNGDGTYTVGGLVDKYADDVKSPEVTFTISPTADPNTYAGVELMTSLPEGAIVKDANGELIARAEDTGTYDLKGSGPITVTVDVGTLMDNNYLQKRDGIYKDYHVYTFTVSALAYDEAMNDQTHDRAASGEIIDTVENKITVNVENTYRPDPGVLAITVDNSDGMTNPDSGAPQGTITLSAYTHDLTSPPTEQIRFEVMHPNPEDANKEVWIFVGTADMSDAVAHSDDLTGIVTDVVNVTQLSVESDMQSEVAIPTLKWSVDVDTLAFGLEDTIKRGQASERDASMDKDRYKVRAIALTPKNMDHPEYPQRDGVEASFSLDNVDDVPPLGPTNITDVADVAGSIAANEDGSYTVSLIDDDPALSTDVMFTIETADPEVVDPLTYAGGKVRLVRADDSNNKDPKNYGYLNADGKAEVTVNVGDLDNGTYQFHALVIDASDNEQVQGEGGDKHLSPTITVHVRNFRVSDITDLTVTAVDGESPDRLPLQETVGELQGRFPLKESISVSFNVDDGSFLEKNDLTGVLIDGHAVTFEPDGEGNAFSLMASGLMAVADGWYTPEGRITKRNGSVTFPLATINLDNTGPMITIVSPTEGEAINGLPSLNAGFQDGDMGSGVSDGSGVSMMDTAAVSLDRLRPEEVVQDAVPIDVDQSMVEQDLDSVVYTRLDQLAGGAYQFTVKVSDKLGNVGEQSVAFAVEGENPTVVITAPAAGQTFDHSPEKVTGFFAGGGEVSITKFTVNDADMTAEVMDNNFSYMPAEALGDGDYTVAVEVTDGSGLTAQTALTFTVELPVPTASIDTPTAGQVYDHGMPIITGEFSGAAPIEVSLSIDGEAVTAAVSGNTFTYTPAEALSDGEHMVAVEVTDANGRMAQASTMFTVDIPGPTVAIHSPAAGQTYDHGKPAIRGEFSGVAASVSLSLILNGESVEAVVSDGEFMYTPADLLVDGEYTVVAQVTDANGKSAEATAIFTVRLPVPTVAIHSPANGQMYDHSKPSITGEFSGLDPVELTLTINGEAVEAVVSDSEFTYTPAEALGDGEYTVVAGVSDANGKSADATVVFSVRLPVPTAAIVTPAAGQSYDHGMPIIHGNFSGAAPVEVSLSIDGEAVEAVVNENNEFTYTPAVALSDGEHMVAVEVTDANGRTAQTSTDFMVDIPGPTVAINSPAAGQMYDHDMPVVRGEFTGVGDVTVALTVNGKEAEAKVEGNGFTYTPAEGLGEGEHTVAVEVTDANGKMAQATAIFTVEFPMASVMLHAPAAGHTYSHGKPAISGEFTGVGDVEVKLTVDGKDVEAKVEGNQFSHTLADALGHGEHTVAVEVTDANGETAQTSAVFTVDIPGPTVIVLSPASGQTYDHGGPVIRGEFSGMTDVEVTTFTVNGEDAEPEINEDNQFTYTPDPVLGQGEHTVFVEVTDANKKTAQTSVVFNVKLDSTAPIISEVSPSGLVTLNKQDTLDENFAITIAAVITEPESTITSVKYVIDGQLPANSYPVERAGSKFEVTESFTPGKHTIKLMVTSEGGTREFSWQFTLEVDKAAPVISSITPTGTIHAGLPVVSVSATDDSGVEEMTIVVMDSNGKEVKGGTSDDDEDRTNAGITRLDFRPEAPLSEGTYTIEVRATDAFGNSSTGSGIFTVDFDTAAPIITASSPQDGARLMYKHDEQARPTISITFADAETGVNVDSIKLVIEAPKWGGGTLVTPINLTDKQKSATQVIYKPAAPVFTDRLAPGEHVVKLEVSDNAHQQGNVSEKSDGAREANTAVYQFSFFVEYADGPILAKPINFPNPFKGNTRISFGLNRMSTVSIVIYDATLRPVRVLRDNVTLNAGDYTGNNGIGWDGKTSGGEDLARGIYFCVIEVTDGFEPESAMLKLALTR